MELPILTMLERRVVHPTNSESLDVAYSGSKESQTKFCRQSGHESEAKKQL